MNSPSIGVATGEQLVLGLRNVTGQQSRHCALIAHRLATDQIIGLNGSGPFVNRQNPRISEMLSGAGFLDETHTTMDLYAQTGHFLGHLGAPALDDRYQKLIERLMLPSLLGICMTCRQVAMSSRHIGGCPATFGQRAHVQEHALDVRMLNDRNGFRATVQCSALNAYSCIGSRLLSGTFGDGDTLHADGITRRVHHDEHVFQAAVLFADQGADRTTMIAKLQDCRGAGLNPQLVFQAQALYVVTYIQAAVCILQKRGNHKQGNTFDAFWRARYACQHQMHDIARHIVLPIGDENLATEYAIATIVHRLGTTSQKGQIRACLRFRQVHGAGPFSRYQAWQIVILLFLATGR
ncbi:hypothetical protein D3C71_1140260 [compost metagenome]